MTKSLKTGEMADLPSNVMDDLDLFTDSFGWDLRSQHYGDGKEVQFIKDTFKSFKAFNRGRAWLFDGKSRRGFKDTDPAYFIYFDSLISGADAFLFHDVQKTYDPLPMDTNIISGMSNYLMSTLLWFEDDKGRRYRPSGNIWIIGDYLVVDESIFSFVRDRLQTGGGMDRFKKYAGRVRVAAADPVTTWGNKQANLNLENVRTLLVAKDMFDYGNQIFAARVDSRHLVYKSDLPDNGQLSIFETAIKGETYKITYIGKKDELPSFSHQTGAVFWISSAAAYLQGTASPTIPMSDISNLLNESRRERIEQSFVSLFNTSIDWTANKGGKQYRRILTRPFSQVEFEGKGKGATVRPTINQAYVKSLQQIGQPGGQYVKIPKQLLAAKKYNMQTLNYFKYLFGLQGHKRVYPIKVETLLIKKAGYSEAKLNKTAATGKDSIYDKTQVLLQSAEDVGLLEGYQLDTASDRTGIKWRLWKVNQRLGSFKGLKGGLFDVDKSAALDVIALIMDWIGGFSNVKKSPGEIHKDLMRWVDKLGSDAVYSTFLDIQNSTEKIHPGHLFRLLQLKAKKAK